MTNMMERWESAMGAGMIEYNKFGYVYTTSAFGSEDEIVLGGSFDTAFETFCEIAKEEDKEVERWQ